MQKLQFLIDTITKARKLHICIADISGILNAPSRKITFANAIHSKPFCDIAKSTERGYRLCLHCKRLAINKALLDKKSFCGHCLYGLYEVSLPVIINQTVVAIIYVGNAIIDLEQTKNKITKACRHTGVDANALYNQASECEHFADSNELLQIAELVCEYIKYLYQTEPKHTAKLHWLVSALKQHVEQTDCFTPTLKELSVIYNKNEKYLGRLFKKEMGVSFQQYSLSFRLQKAQALLLKKEDKIINIALECGFNNVSYFNRAFKSQYGLSPTEYALSMPK